MHRKKNSSSPVSFPPLPRQLLQLPRVLIIHLKRYKMHEQLGSVCKNFRGVTIPKFLNVESVVSRDECLLPSVPNRIKQPELLVFHFSLFLTSLFSAHIWEEKITNSAMLFKCYHVPVLYPNKTGSSQVGAISKAQKYSRNNYWKHLQKIIFQKKYF